MRDNKAKINRLPYLQVRADNLGASVLVDAPLLVFAFFAGFLPSAQIAQSEDPAVQYSSPFFARLRPSGFFFLPLSACVLLLRLRVRFEWHLKHGVRVSSPCKAGSSR